MARPIFSDIFFRLPPATAVLLLCAVLDKTRGHALPRQTNVIESRGWDVIALPPEPTGKPLSPFDVQRRQEEENTVCGYLGGSLKLPATCSLGSHCVLDSANSVVGCCPNGGPCTTGVFTTCVDRNSDPQTEINPYVYTCQGTDLCFKNNFAGGYFQFGCGTASELGTTVQTSADGATTPLSIETVEISMTQLPVLLATPTTIGSLPSTETISSDQAGSQLTSGTLSSMTPVDPSSSSTSPGTSTSASLTVPASSRTSTHTISSETDSSSSTSSLPSSSSSSRFAPSPTAVLPTPKTMEGSDSAKQSQTGAIIGGVVGGAAAAISLVALIFFCLRRRNRNNRIGPEPTPTAPPIDTGPMQSHGAAFAPLPSWHDDEVSSTFQNHSHEQPPAPYGPLEPSHPAPPPTFLHHNRLTPNAPDSYGTLEATLSAPGPASLGPAAPRGFLQPPRYNRGYMPVGMSQSKGSLTPVAEEDQSTERDEPQQQQQQQQAQTPEIYAFSQAYSNAGIGQLPDDEDTEEDRTPLRGRSGDNSQEDDDSSLPRRSGGSRPLWQQHRQRSRNLMWL
ncbi:hypothetical protein F5Y14DRAFT_450999 [Nemania sp. NC0429]|nr:hypothetical protein F5Y14DRAFT_450999 [Nemania sp. NC0429]